MLAPSVRFLAETVAQLLLVDSTHDQDHPGPLHQGCRQRIATAVDKLCSQGEGVRELATELLNKLGLIADEIQ